MVDSLPPHIKRGRPAVFLDRDGTVSKEVGYLKDPDHLELIPGSAQAIARLRELGFAVVVATNQSGVGRGYFDMHLVEATNARLEELLAREGVHLDGIYVCPHHPDDGCACRKPAPGMALQAQKDLGLDLDCSYVVGDRPSDIELGQGLGVRTVLVLTGYGRESMEQVQPDFVAEDLREAVEWIERDWRRRETT
jgi:D-glycero-D-manno-heptose 1,7-bisphosphate phosphatase